MRFNLISKARGQTRRWWQRGVLLLCLPGFALAAWSQAALQREYEIKAAYLYNFINYIDWPSQGLPPTGSPMTIGVIGDNPFGPALSPLQGKKVKGRTLAVKEIVTPADLRDCQIVFISPSEKPRMTDILEQLRNSNVLTVSEIQGFAERGGIINFILEKNKVRFEINADAARRTGLTISSELLKLARLVKS